ncbi:uncharacterized protein LOC144633791 [Oculina patagonica]
MMNTWSLSLALLVICCCIFSVHSKECDNDKQCWHYGRCCAGHCIWHHLCACVNDKDCKSTEKCITRGPIRYCKPTEEPSYYPPTYTSHPFNWWHDHDTHPTSKTEKPHTYKKETHKTAHSSWRHGSKVILISCLLAAVAVIPCIYYVLKKTRKRPASTSVTAVVLSPQATQTGMAGAAVTSARANVLEMQPGSAIGATAMEGEAGPCPFKAPGALPNYYSLEFERQEKEKDEPPPSYDDAVKPAVVPLE